MSKKGGYVIQLSKMCHNSFSFTTMERIRFNQSNQLWVDREFIVLIINKERSLNAKMKCYPEVATSPIFINDKDYGLSIDPDLITLVESDPFHGYETETIVAHLTKLNDIATLFTHDEKTRYYFILKLFLFSLKGDAKAWYNTLAPGCVRSPQDMIYYFCEK